MRMEEALQGVSSILIDSAPAIYFLERHPRYADLLDTFFRVRAEQGILIVTTPVTLAECLVQPLRQGLDDLVSSYSELLLSGQNTTFHTIGSYAANNAARVRADHRLRLPDAFQVAIARQTGCDAILTNDTSFKRVDHPRVIILDELLEDDA